MTKQRLAQISLEDLQHLAAVYDIDVPDDEDDRATLEEAIFDAIEEARIDAESGDSFPIRYHQRRFDEVGDFWDWAHPDQNQSFSLPPTYHVTRLVAMLRDPAWVFVYWELSLSDETRHTRQEDFDGFFLRLVEFIPGGEPIFLDIPIQLSDLSRYINLPNQNRQYQVRLMVRHGTTTSELASSIRIKVPLGGLSAQVEVINSYELDAIIALSGISKLGVAEMPAIPQRILSFKEGS